MRKGDMICAIVVIIFFGLFFVPVLHQGLIFGTLQFPYLAGFIKFFILASFGELLALRIVYRQWRKPVGMIYRAIIWGLLGIIMVLVFACFSNGIVAAMTMGLLPFKSSTFAFALFVSLMMNIIFAPTMMGFHRITDTYIDLYCTHLETKITLNTVAKHIDWSNFLSFVIAKTIPFFWIPAHTMTFLLPNEYRVLMAALLSIILGALLAFAKTRKN